MRVLIADDQAEVRSALRLLLEQEPGVAVAAEAANSALLLELVHESDPDILLLDWELPGMSSSELLSSLRKTGHKMLIVAMSGRPEAQRAALAAGVDYFVSKGDPPERVLVALGKARARSSS